MDPNKYISDSPALLAAASKNAEKSISRLVAEAAAEKAKGKERKKGK